MTDEKRVVGPADIMMAYKQVAALPEGQIVIDDLLRRFGFTRTSTYVHGDAIATTFREGQRTVLVHIGRMIEGDPAEFASTSKREGEHD